MIDPPAPGRLADDLAICDQTDQRALHVTQRKVGPVSQVGGVCTAPLYGLAQSFQEFSFSVV
jgi:hypothetical protein